MKKWSLSGFEAFSKGTLGNGGQNLYVSAKGVLQRIWQFDVNKDGYVDLLIANSHDYNEHPSCLGGWNQHRRAAGIQCRCSK